MITSNRRAGGFGGKVPVYPGYVLADRRLAHGAQPVKWIEDRIVPASSTARDYHIHAELAAAKDTVAGLKVKKLARLHRCRRGPLQVSGRHLLRERDHRWYDFRTRS